MPSWVLAIDFGTSFTVAASTFEGHAPEVIEIAGERRMPSVILIDGELTVVGRVAEDLSATNPRATIRALKNRLGDQAPLVLDGRPYPVVELVAILLRHVYDEAVRQLSGPPAAVHLTHPATWNRPRLNRLLEAADRAGLPSPVLVPEPVAAALSFASEVGIEPGSSIAVYDLGGGTFDSAVVTSGGGGFRVVGRPGGDQHIGGELFDEIVVNHLGERLDPAAWDRIQSDNEAPWPQVASTLRNEARRAKETLSSNHYADLIVPMPAGLVQLRLVRSEYETLIRPFIDETVVLLERCVAEAGLVPASLAGVSLAGGASRTPMVEAAVGAAFGSVPLIRRADPKTAVALGATMFDRDGAPSFPPRSGSQPSQPPVSSPPAGPPPVSQPPAQPASAAPSTPAAPHPRPAANLPPPSAPVLPPAPIPLASPPHAPTGGRRRWLAIAVVAIVAVIAIGGWLLFGGSDGSDQAELPSRAEVTDALLPIRELRLVGGSEWVVADVELELVELCEQFDVPDAAFDRDIVFGMVETGEGRDGADAESVVAERITVYRSVADAEAAFAREVAVAEECESERFEVDGVSYTFSLEDATSETRSIGRDAERVIAAARYDVAPSDALDEVIRSGYIIEQRIGLAIVSIDGYISNRDVIDEDLAVFLELADTTFRYAEGRLAP